MIYGIGRGRWHATRRDTAGAMNIPDELLAAYLDGELEGAERLRVEQAIARDARLAQRVAQQRALRERRRGVIKGVWRESVPQRLLHAARLAAPIGTAQVIDLAHVRAVRSRRGERPRAAMSRRVAIALSLLVGTGAGLLIERLSASGVLTEYRAGAVIARGGLAHALDEQIAGLPAIGSIRIGITFRDRSGAYCRTFAISEGHPLAGLACRAQGQWQVPALLATADSGARHAAAIVPTTLLPLVKERISGAPLDAQAEERARSGGWR